MACSVDGVGHQHDEHTVFRIRSQLIDRFDSGDPPERRHGARSAGGLALAGDLRHRVVRMQAFEMRDPHIETLYAGIDSQRGGDTTGSVFAEHQVLGVEPRERLFVFPLDCGLYRRAQRGFGAIDQISHRQFIKRRLQFDPDLGAAALRVRRGRVRTPASRAPPVWTADAQRRNPQRNVRR